MLCSEANNLLEVATRSWKVLVELGNVRKHEFDYRLLFQGLSTLTCLELSLLLACSVMLTAVRYLLTHFIAMPLSNYWNLKEKDGAKLPESLWKFIVYLVMWSYACWLCVFSDFKTVYGDSVNSFKTDLADEDSNLWANFPVPFHVAMIYLMQSAFYVHCIFGTLFMDEWRKDSYVMLFHHLLTLALISTSYTCRLWNAGIIIFFLHDMSDVLLEFTKMNKYLSVRADKSFHFINDTLSSIGFICFTVSWAYARIYLFSYKVIDTTFYGYYCSYGNMEKSPWIFFGIFLLILFGLNIYWFSLIGRLCINRALCQSQIQDTREYSECESTKSK